MIAKRTRKGILLYTSLALLASQTALVQKGFGQAPSVAPYNQPTLPDVGKAGPTRDFQHSFADQAFVKLVLERDATDIQLGQLAQRKSESLDIKQLGQKMSENRTTLNEQFEVMAKSLDVAAPKGPTKKDDQLIARLAALTGPQFDEEYLKAVAKSNRQDLKDFQAEAQNAQDPYLLHAVQQDTPVLSKHLQAIGDVAKVHNVALNAKK